MKGRMDVLNFEKQLSSESEIKSYRDRSTTYEEFKMELDGDEREKENGDVLSECSDLVIDTGVREMNDGNVREQALEENTGNNEDDDVIPDLPVLSVIIKEEDGVLEYNDGVPLPKPRSQVEIKYEDDIEEEDYDSEDSETPSSVHMREFTSLQDDDRSNSVSSSIMIDPQIKEKNLMGNHTDRCFNSYFETSSGLHYQTDSHLGRKFSINGTEETDILNKDKSSDSVLLSIVYATINVPFSQVSKFLIAYNLSKSQLSLIRKVRRQVKNRLYAQNCRRRRVAHIKNLANELQQLKHKKGKLCSIRDELTTKKKFLESRYKQLYDYIMNVLKERCEQAELLCVDDDDDDENLYDDDYLEMQIQKLIDERKLLENKKQKLETEYDTLYKHVFKVISDRNLNNSLARNGIDDSLDFQLCNMNIVNELAMLNQYWAKNNTIRAESMDLESSVSVDGSRTSENKLNDFVDYESGVSIDGSRTEENTLNDDLVDYESSMDEIINIQHNGHLQSQLQFDSNSLKDTKMNSIENICMTEESSSLNDEKKIAWTDQSDDQEDTEDENENDTFWEELKAVRSDLEQKKKNVEEQYTELYNHILKASKMDEIEFLKAFMDHCIRLLKVSTGEQSTDASEVS